MRYRFAALAAAAACLSGADALAPPPALGAAAAAPLTAFTAPPKISQPPATPTSWLTLPAISGTTDVANVTFDATRAHGLGGRTCWLRGL